MTNKFTLLTIISSISCIATSFEIQAESNQKTKQNSTSTSTSLSPSTNNININIKYSPILDKRTINIETPSFTKRTTEKIKLPNGLEALLISDPDATNSGAMLSVAVGSWDDPRENPGLAHYTEHMLFMGTKSYPNETEYERFIYDHNGEANAFTASSSTSYLFTINNPAFPEALKRFASFFKEPLFSPSGSERELNAIDQEYGKNLNNDHIRQFYVLKELINEEHPFHSFNMGNKESLKSTSNETIRNWYDQHYSANLMKLVAYSSQPIDELRNEVVNAFEGIPNHQKIPSMINKPIFSDQIKGHYVYVEPVTNKRTLTLYWELPSKFSHALDNQPESIICHVLGHEGDHSLLAHLKKENLADGISCGGNKIGNDLFLSFLEINLTEEGLQDINKVVTRSFQAIKNMKQKGIPDYIFDEIKQMASIEYQFQSKKNEFDMLMEHAYNIQDEDMATYPENTKIPQQKNHKLIQEFLDYLTPANTYFFIMAPINQSKVKMEKTETWLKVPYTVKKIPQDEMDRWKNIHPIEQIDLPRPNIFIPENLSATKNHIRTTTQQLPSALPRTHLENTTTEEKRPSVLPRTHLENTTTEEKRLYKIPHPHAILDDSKGKIYFANDTIFGVPKISWILTIKTPEIDLRDPQKIVLGDLYEKILIDELNTITYPAQIAGLKFKVERKDNGIQLAINGYSSQAKLLLEQILEKMTSFTLNPETFKIHKESLLREYQNSLMDSPIEQANEIKKSIVYESFVTDKEKGATLRKITCLNFQEFLARLFTKTYLEGMLSGDLTEQKANDVVTLLKTTFNQGDYPVNEQFRSKVIVLPNDQGPYFVDAHTKAKGNAALLVVEDKDYSLKQRAAQQLLMQAIREPFFSALRTKQQTGYIVDSQAEELERKLFNLFAVQSNTHAPRDLLARFEAFVESYLMELGKTELTTAQFDNIKNALIVLLQAPTKNIEDTGKLLNQLAFEYDGDFLWMSKRVEAMRGLTYEEVIEFARKVFGKDNKRRLAILLTGEMSEKKAFSYDRARNGHVVRKAGIYEGRYVEGGGNEDEKRDGEV